MPAELPAHLKRLGNALGERTQEVLELTVARTRAGSPLLDALVRDSFERICILSTAAFARLLAGEDPQVTMAVGREAGQIFGQLASQRAAPLNEVIVRCVRWRDAAAKVLRASAAELELPEAALAQALTMLQSSVDLTLVYVGECVEVERKHTDDELARREQELSFLVTHDALTGLPSRTLVVDRLEQKLLRARRDHAPVAALFVDIDNFKAVNDAFGHDAGDALLKAVAVRLDTAIRANDTLGRLGGDEFVVIAEKLHGAVTPELIAQRLLDALREPFTVVGARQRHLSVTASIGIASAGEDCVDCTPQPLAEELLRDARIAMYRAKWDGKGRHVVFESAMQRAVQNRIRLEMELRDALARDEFFLVYQPTFDLCSMVATGTEALLRWRHPTRGVLPPNDFIPLLEATGLITQVGSWVLEEACRQLAVWRAAGHAAGVAVNVSARQLDTDELLVDVEGALAHSGLDAGALTLEITETALMRDLEATARRLLALKRLGVRIAVDDFGTGYSSLAHLQRFPVDTLKIDRSFVYRVADSEEGQALVHTLIELGHALSIETLAEGIERQQDLLVLQRERCDSGQGYLLARPLDADAVDAFLHEHTGSAARSAA